MIVHISTSSRLDTFQKPCFIQRQIMSESNKTCWAQYKGKWWNVMACNVKLIWLDQYPALSARVLNNWALANYLGHLQIQEHSNALAWLPFSYFIDTIHGILCMFFFIPIMEFLESLKKFLANLYPTTMGTFHRTDNIGFYSILYSQGNFFVSWCASLYVLIRSSCSVSVSRPGTGIFL